MSSSFPTIIFIPGAFHTPFHFSRIISSLAQHNYPSTALPLPTIGTSAQTATLKDDIHSIRAVLEKHIVDEEKEVVLVMHSAGSLPGCQTVSGLERSVRKAEGKSGGVIACVFIAAFLIPEGKSLQDMRVGVFPPPWAVDDGQLLHPKDPGNLFYSDLPADEASAWEAKLQPLSRLSANTAVENACWELDMPITYVICDKDMVTPVPVQEARVDSMKNERWTVRRIESGHCPFLSMPDELARLLVETADQSTSRS